MSNSSQAEAKGNSSNMENTSTYTSFFLDDYLILDQQKSLFFIIFLLLYAAMLILNIFLITVIYLEKTLHNPMYIFVCNLSCNSIYGSTGLMPHLLINLASQVHVISLPSCLVQVFCLHTYNIVELTTLAFMGYDRFVAICRPLHYHSMMSARRLQTFIVFIWAYTFITFFVYETFTIRLTFCKNIISKTHCVNFELIKLSCSDIKEHSAVGMSLMAITVFPQLIMIVFSYAQILRVCWNSSEESKTKAFQTCSPHFLACINYLVGIFFELIQSRFNTSHLPLDFRTFMSLYFLIFPPLVNPIVYGMSGQVMRNSIQNLFRRNKIFVLK